MRIIWRSILSLILFAASAFSQDWEHVGTEEINLTAAADYPDAVILFDRGFATTEQDGLTFQRHTRLKVFTPEGLDRVKQVEIAYLHYDRLSDLQARIHRKGSMIPISAKKSSTTIAKGPWRYCTLEIHDLQPGDIFEYRYKVEYYAGFDELGPEAYFLFGQDYGYEGYELKKEIQSGIDMFGEGIAMRNLPTWYFDHQVFCVSSQFTAKIGADFDYLYYPTNLPPELAEPVIEKVKVLIGTLYKKHTWSVRDIRPYDSLVDGHRISDLNRCGLHFNRFNSAGWGQNRIIYGRYADVHWRYVGTSMQGYLNEYLKTTGATERKFVRLWSAEDSPAVRMAKACTYLNDGFSTDSSGYHLHPVHKNLEKLFKKKRGAPFELNLLLLKMLKVAGLKAWPVLISTRDKVPFQLSGEFNHILVMVELDDNSVFLDVVSPGSSCDHPSEVCQVPKGVRVDFDNSHLVDIRFQ